MITRADVDKLLGMTAPGPTLASLYLQVPRDPAELRELPARADELLALAARDGLCVGAAERDTARELLETRARTWLGHTVAIFACADLGLAEAIPVPVRLQERAVLGVCPHVRPLLAAIQRCPAYRVVVADRRHAWLFSVADQKIRAAALPDADNVRSSRFGGWYGLESYRVNSRIIQLARHHYRDAAALLEHAAESDGIQPFVVCGHEDSIPQLLAATAHELRAQFAGSFVADVGTLTPARVRELSGQVIAGWVANRDGRLRAELLAEPPDGRTVTGLNGCATAVGQHAVAMLAVPAGGVVPGYACRVCGALSSGGDGCEHGASVVAVPDLLEELAVRVLADGGQVFTIDDVPGEVAARLRFRPARS